MIEWSKEMEIVRDISGESGGAIIAGLALIMSSPGHYLYSSLSPAYINLSQLCK